MSPRLPAPVDERKALLVARAELERTQLALLVHEVREIVAPRRAPRPPGRKAAPLAVGIVALGLPLFGRRKLLRLLRAGTLALSAWRFARHWQRGPH